MPLKFPWQQGGKAGAESGQTHGQVLVYSPAPEGGTSLSQARWDGQASPWDAALSACSRLFSSELAPSWEPALPHPSLDTGD